MGSVGLGFVSGNARFGWARYFSLSALRNWLMLVPVLFLKTSFAWDSLLYPQRPQIVVID